MRHETHAAMFLEAYRTGEIRDAGPMYVMPGFKDMGMIFVDKADWYKLDPAVFDELVDDSARFFRRLTVLNMKRVWDIIAYAEQDGIIVSQVQATAQIIALYKAGILRQGGKMPEVCDREGVMKFPRLYVDDPNFYPYWSYERRKDCPNEYRHVSEFDELLKALRRAEQTIRNLGHGNLTGDARLIALNEAQNIRDAIAKAEGREL